jgi:hypothetical protein
VGVMMAMRKGFAAKVGSQQEGAAKDIPPPDRRTASTRARHLRNTTTASYERKSSPPLRGGAS